MTETLLDVLFQASIRGSILCICVLLVTMLLRRAAPAIRHLLWLSALAGFLMMPVAFLALPPLTVSVPKPFGADIPITLPALSATTQTFHSIGFTGPASLPQTVSFSPAPAFDWRSLIALLWASGVLVMAGRSLYATALLRRVSRRAAPLEDRYAADASMLARRFSSGRPVRILQAGLRGAPVTFGFLRPVVLLPLGLAGSPGDELTLIMAHEMAHVRRHDALTGQIGYLIACVFWFVPLAWFALYRLRVEQEKACDAAALEIAGEGWRYAEMLLRACATINRSFTLVRWTAQMIGERAFTERIRAVLNWKERKLSVRKPILSAILLAVVAGMAIVSMTQCGPATSAKTTAQRRAERGIQLVWRSGKVTSIKEKVFIPESYPIRWPLSAQGLVTNSYRSDKSSSYPSVLRAPTVGSITAIYGPSINPLTKKNYVHPGIDIAWVEGTPIMATANGTVLLTGYSMEEGHSITILHPSGFVTRYCHLASATKVKLGDTVQAGQTIGYLGNSGYSTGPHLHYEILLDGNTIDPLDIIAGKFLVPGEYGNRVEVTLKNGRVVTINGSDITREDLPLLWPLGQPWSKDLAKRVGKIVQTFQELHTGIVIAGTPGEAVVATAGGTVIHVGSDAIRGQYVIVKHAGELQTQYTHLDIPVLVKKGEVVHQSQQVGFVSRTGYANGPNLFYSILYRGEPIDPLELMDGKVTF